MSRSILVLLARAHQERQAARAGGDDRNAFGGTAGGSDREQLRARLRGELPEWRRRPQEHVQRNHEKLNGEINAANQTETRPCA
jgi:hypothetical protein